MVHSYAPYELMAAVLAGESPSAGQTARAFAAPHKLWQRALALEACAVQFDRALRHSTVTGGAPSALRRELSDATARAVRDALRVPAQIAELASVARECGIRVMVLKGGARLLRGALPGGRALVDIDVLATPAEARHLHTVLQQRFGYQSIAAAPEHHLPMLSRAGALPLEVHVQLGPSRTPLDARIWEDAEGVRTGDGELLVPSATTALLHWLEHGALVHWAARYRLRDLLDVAEAWVVGVDAVEVRSYLAAHRQRLALETLLGAARRFCSAIPMVRRSAWTTVRRVGRARHLVAAYIRRPTLAKSLCIAAGVLAEASPRALFRPAQLALFGVQRARVD